MPHEYYSFTFFVPDEEMPVKLRQLVLQVIQDVIAGRTDDTESSDLLEGALKNTADICRKVPENIISPALSKESFQNIRMT